MKKRLSFILAVGMAAILTACGSQADSDVAESDVTPTQETDEVRAQDQEDTSTSLQEAEETSPQEADDTSLQTGEDAQETDTQFSFADLQTTDFIFASGAGAWGTSLQIHPDGSFEGDYHDSDMGNVGEGYPHGTVYESQFQGTFAQPVKVDDHTYSLQISEITCAQEPGTSEIKDQMLHEYTDAFGLAGTEEMLLYLPGTPLSELSEEIQGWVVDPSDTDATELSGYALVNEPQQQGFAGHDIVADIKDRYRFVLEDTSSMEQSMDQDAHSQDQLNETSKAMYEEWDYVLNDLWGVLKRCLDTKQMQTLTQEQRTWIAEKEQKIKETETEYDTDPRQAMLANQGAAHMTKERVQQLMEYLDQ